MYHKFVVIIQMRKHISRSKIDLTAVEYIKNIRKNSGKNAHGKSDENFVQNCQIVTYMSRVY